MIPQPGSRDRRQYPRYPCSAPIQISWLDGFDKCTLGECVQVCRNGLRILVEQPIPVLAAVGLRTDALGLSGRGTIRYSRRQNAKYIVGVEFVGGLQWRAPQLSAATASLSAGMTPRTSAIFEALLAGSSAAELQVLIDQLSADERNALLCTASSIQSALAANCKERADEVDRLLEKNDGWPRRLLPVL